MKNLYLCKILVVLISITSFGQELQNANWYFGGDNWVNFDPINSTPSNVSLLPFSDGVGLGFLEGCASVSDRGGQLLFITDGKSVYQNMGKSFKLLTNQLLGQESSAQNVIIVPKPNNPNRYYVFTIDGYSGELGGLYYTEFDFSGPVGQVIGSINIPLRYENNTQINQLALNKSEGITSVKHNNCVDYWVVAHATTSINNNNTGRIYSYLVTANGVVNNLPTQATNFNINFN